MLQLKVVDPAMGSGHFLVGACRFIAEKLLDGYKRRFVEVQKQNPNLPESEIFPLAQIPPQVARVWHDEEKAMAACKLLVASHCLYGVDKNLLAVDLAKVTLWIETAAADQPLTFLDHRLKVGDSLLGIPLKRILPSGLFANLLKERIRQALQHLSKLDELISHDPSDLNSLRQTHKAMESELEPFWKLHQIAVGAKFSQNTNNEWETKLKGGELESALQLGERLRKIGEQNHAFSWELAFPDVFFEPDGNEKTNAGFDAVLGNPPWDKVQAERIQFYAQFDLLISDYQGQSLEQRIQNLHQQDPTIAQKWDEYTALVEAYNRFLTRSGVYLHQFATFCGSCNALLPEKKCPNCGLPTPVHTRCRYCNSALFKSHEPMICSDCGANLREVGIETTSGREDLYRFFAERAWQLAKNGGYVGFLLPAAFYATEGATALRRLILDKSKLVACFSFENRRRLFPIDANYKFANLVYCKGGKTDEFPAAFMLHDPQFLELPETHPERLRRQVTLTRGFLETTSPSYRLFLEVKNEFERRLAYRLHQKFPRLGERISGTWNVGFTTELHMTQDSYLFRTAEQLERNLALRQEPDPQNRIGGILYRTPDAQTYREKGYRVVNVPQFGIEVALPADALKGLTEEQIETELKGEFSQTSRRRTQSPVPNPRSLKTLREVLTYGFVCNDEYVPLYEGKMVHQFDPAAKAYVSGEGHRQQWRPLGWHEKHLRPHFFVSRKIFAKLLPEQQRFRAGFVDVASHDQVRSLQVSVIPSCTPCGNTVPTVVIEPEHCELALLWSAFGNSVIADWLIKKRIKDHLNFFVMSQLPMPRISPDEGLGCELVVLAARLNCVIPELAELWEEVAKHYPEAMHPRWQLPNPDLLTCQLARLPVVDPFERQFLRARIDALVADAYELSVEEFAYILSTFPLLDRDQPPLPLSLVPRPSSPDPQSETEPKSTITRDLALCAYMLHKGWRPSPFGEEHPEFHNWLCEKLGIKSASTHSNPQSQVPSPQIPSDLAKWFAENVPEAQIPEMGEIRDLEERLFVTLKQLGSIAYIPTQREREEAEESENETEETE
ncbi:MAG: hypothetical protein RMK94_04455 [Armatimonadota bacterium]|nr:hypothetical protein [Armatimonadota bacterium]